jgi:hypothetical protein
MAKIKNLLEALGYTNPKQHIQPLSIINKAGFFANGRKLPNYRSPVFFYDLLFDIEKMFKDITWPTDTDMMISIFYAVKENILSKIQEQNISNDNLNTASDFGK